MFKGKTSSNVYSQFHKKHDRDDEEKFMFFCRMKINRNYENQLLVKVLEKDRTGRRALWGERNERKFCVFCIIKISQRWIIDLVTARNSLIFILLKRRHKKEEIMQWRMVEHVNMSDRISWPIFLHVENLCVISDGIHTNMCFKNKLTTYTGPDNCFISFH